MSPSTKSPTSSRLPAEHRFGRKLPLSLGRETVSLQPRLVELLVDSLRQLGSADGDAVADEVASLARAGIRIDLRLSAPELGALADAITRTNTPARPLDPTFARLLAHLRARQAE